MDSVDTATANLLFLGNAYWASRKTFALKWGSSTYSSLCAWRAAGGQEKGDTADTGFGIDPRINGPVTADYWRCESSRSSECLLASGEFTFAKQRARSSCGIWYWHGCEGLLRKRNSPKQQLGHRRSRTNWNEPFDLIIDNGDAERGNHWRLGGIKPCRWLLWFDIFAGQKHTKGVKIGPV